ncbi:hypothetical protein [Escherichia phage M01]|nr:hypothetical protein [Escherichia phage M01]
MIRPAAAVVFSSLTQPVLSAVAAKRDSRWPSFQPAAVLVDAVCVSQDDETCSCYDSCFKIHVSPFSISKAPP